jgi:LPS export ABC transporter protein LptC
MKKFLFFAIAVFVFSGCGRQVSLTSPQTNLVSPQTSPEPAQRINKFSVEGYTEGGKKSWEIEGESADIVENVVKLDNVKAKAYGEEQELDLKSNKGEYDKKEGIVRLEEDVVVTSSQGAKITTQSLLWDAQKEAVTTPEEVRIEKDSLVCQGKGASAFPDAKTVKVNAQVKVEIEPKTTITSSGPLELDYERNICVFYDNVEVDDERGSMFADRMEVYFEPATKKIEKIFAYGNVRIIQDENTAYSDEAVYDSLLGKVTLKGHPRLVIYPGDINTKPITNNQ